MLSPSLEDYLEELYRLKKNNKDIKLKYVADYLQVSMPSVVNGFRRLDKLGYIYYRPYQEIKVTAKGERKGKFLVTRNRILRDFIKAINSDCDAEKEAEAMEHYLSISTIKQIEKIVSYFNDNKEVLNEVVNYEIKSKLEE